MKKHRSCRLYVEELENRLVPSAVPPNLWGSSNWSGYSVDTTAGAATPVAGKEAAGAVTEVAGTWVVQKVSGKGTTYSSVWVGIDGDNSPTVEQIGTDSDLVNGKAVYYAWWEMYGQPTDEGSTTISSIAIHAGDTIVATVQALSASQFQLTITDTSDKESFTTTQTVGTPVEQSSAEWIVERPELISSRGRVSLATLSPFTTVTFTNAEAAVNNGPLMSISALAASSSGADILPSGAATTLANAIDMYNGRTVIAATSQLNSAGTSFVVAYGSSTPAAPSNGTNSKSATKSSTEQIVAVVETTGPSNQPSTALIVTVVTSSGQVEVILLFTQPSLTVIPETSGFGLTSFGENSATGTPPPPVAPSASTPVVIRPTFQSEPSGFDGEAPGTNENGPAFPLPPSEKWQEAPDMPWPSDSRFAAGPPELLPAPGRLGDSHATPALPNPGPAITPVGPVAGDAELDALFSNWQPAVDAPLASAGPRLDSTDMLLATVALGGMVVWSQERRQEAEGKQPAFRAP